MLNLSQISNEKLLIHLERGLVNTVCSTGIEVNSCVADPYERVMLPYISGLGPRKADVLINAVLKLVRLPFVYHIVSIADHQRAPLSTGEATRITLVQPSLRTLLDS